MASSRSRLPREKHRKGIDKSDAGSLLPEFEPTVQPKAIKQQRSDKGDEMTGMDLFHNAKSVRLRGHLGKYLIAEEDQKSITQSRNGSSKTARWTVEFSTDDSSNFIRLKSCYNKYLTASNQFFLLGTTGQKVLQTLPRKLDSSVEWEPIREGQGTQVKLKTRSGKFLRANGGMPPWRNSVTHDIPHRTAATQDWIFWDVEIIEIQLLHPPPSSSSKSAPFSGQESTDSPVTSPLKAEEDGLRLELEAELSKEPKATTSSLQQFPILMKRGLELTESSPNAEEWYNAEYIHLMDKGLSNLPEEPMCPKLTLLFLQRNYKLRKISTSFFINMPLLKFLDLSKTGIMSLPKSLFELSRLKELYVKDCEFLMMLPPEIGKLKCLEILDMKGTEIINLPVEIKELAVLRCLRVSLYGCIDQEWKSRQADELIPFGVISALSELEDIYIYVNPDNERWGACVEGILNEICGLTRLRNLGFYFPRVELLRCLKYTGTSMIYQSLSKFRFIVGDHSKRIISSLPSSVEFELERMGRHNRCLKYINGEVVPEEIKKVLKYAATFHLDRHMTAKNLTEFGIENMEGLQYCVLGECNEIEVIVDGNVLHEEDNNGEIVCESSGDRRIGGLESLQVLYIYNMKNLKSIWEEPVHKRCFSRLKSLTMSTCPQLTTIFSMGLLENLHKLEEITVRDCPAMKSLVSCEEGVKQSANYLPQLMTISLHYLPELVSISNEVCIAPILKELSLYNCPKLKSLSIKEVSSEHLKEITGEKDWWEALEWTQVERNQFDSLFVPINEDTCL